MVITDPVQTVTKPIVTHENQSTDIVVTVTAGQSITLPFFGGDSNKKALYLKTDWGDGTVVSVANQFNSNLGAARQHTYTDAGTYTIKIAAGSRVGVIRCGRSSAFRSAVKSVNFGDISFTHNHSLIPSHRFLGF